jgi:hypothetical protein
MTALVPVVLKGFHKKNNNSPLGNIVIKKMLILISLEISIIIINIYSLDKQLHASAINYTHTTSVPHLH